MIWSIITVVCVIFILSIGFLFLLGLAADQMNVFDLSQHAILFLTLVGALFVSSVIAVVAQKQAVKVQYTQPIKQSRAQVAYYEQQKNYLNGQLSNLKPGSAIYAQKLHQLVVITDQKTAATTKLNHLLVERAAND